MIRLSTHRTQVVDLVGPQQAPRPKAKPLAWTVPVLQGARWVRSQLQGRRPELSFGFHRPAVAGATLGAMLAVSGCGGTRNLDVADFKDALGSNSEREQVVEALFRDPEFGAMWRYLAECRAGPPGSMGPINLRIDDDSRNFGTWSDNTRTLTVNGDHPAYDRNPQELVDTITHEVVHAIDSLAKTCEAAGSEPTPIGAAGNAEISSVVTVRGTPDEARLLRELGPGASYGCSEFLDINTAAQDLVVRVVRRNIVATGIGGPTLTFVNQKLREDGATFAGYQACHVNACASPDRPAQKAAVLACQEQVLEELR